MPLGLLLSYRYQHKTCRNTEGTLKDLAAAVAKAAPDGLLGSGARCNGASCAPSIGTDGADNLLLTASRGSVWVDTKDCGAVDVCTVAKALEAIKAGLDQL
jgi:hypothetical protein